MTEPVLTYRIRHGDRDDQDTLLQLRRHAEQWLAGAGVKQWTSSETGNRVITTWIEAGNMYVIEDQAGEIIGCLALAGGDPDFWTPEELQEDALYLYKFILRSDHRGNGLGDLLLDWACQQAEIREFLWLRLDCRLDNDQLHQYYLRRGFHRYATRTDPGRQSGALFQRVAEVRTVHDPQVRLIDNTAGVTFAQPPRTAVSGEPPRTVGGMTEANYDPTGEAAIWAAAAALVSGMKLAEPMPGDTYDYWNTSLTQAARALEKRGMEIRQAGGMYYRVLDGSNG